MSAPRNKNLASLVKADALRIALIVKVNLVVLDAITLLHEVVFETPPGNLLYHPQFKKVIREKEAVVSHALKLGKAVERLGASSALLDKKQRKR